MRAGSLGVPNKSRAYTIYMVYASSYAKYILTHIYCANPFRTAVPFWGQTTQFSSILSPKRDCGSIGVNNNICDWATGTTQLRIDKIRLYGMQVRCVRIETK